MISGFLLAGLAALFAASFMSTGPDVDDDDESDAESPYPEDEGNAPDILSGDGGGDAHGGGPEAPDQALELPDWDDDTAPVWLGNGGGTHTDVTATSGVQVLDGFQPGTDTVSVHLETWDTEISELSGDTEGPALSFGETEDATVLKFPGLEELPSDDINLVVGNDEGPLVTVRLSDAIAPDDDGGEALLPLDPDADEYYGGADDDLPAVPPEDPETPDLFPDVPSDGNGLPPVPAEEDGIVQNAGDMAEARADDGFDADRVIPGDDNPPVGMEAPEDATAPGEDDAGHAAGQVTPPEEETPETEVTGDEPPPDTAFPLDKGQPSDEATPTDDPSDAAPPEAQPAPEAIPDTTVAEDPVEDLGTAPPVTDAASQEAQPAPEAIPEAPADPGAAKDSGTGGEPVAPGPSAPPAEASTAPQPSEPEPSSPPAQTADAGKSGSSGDPPAAQIVDSPAPAPAPVVAPVAKPADQIELSVRKNGPAADVFDFDPGHDVLKITVESGPGKGNAVSVQNSADGKDSLVLVGKQVVAVLHGVPGVTMSDLVVRYAGGK